MWWERAYSHRWREEHGFAQKARFHDGFGHLATRRLAVYLAGFAIFSVFMLRRGVLYPEYNRRAISRHFSLPKFQRRLLKNLPAA